MKKFILACWLLALPVAALAADELRPTGLVVTQPQVEGMPGTTFFNQVTLTNATDSVSHVQLTLTAPAAFRLLTQLPALVTIQPHSFVRIPLKFLITREWRADAAVVRIETRQVGENTLPGTGSTIEFVVQQNRNIPPVLIFTLETERPYFIAGQDTLPIMLRFSNQGAFDRTVRLQLFSLPSGFRLMVPNQIVTIGARRDTLIQVNCMAGGSLQWNRNYDLTIEVQDYDQEAGARSGRKEKTEAGTLLGSVVCHPLLLTSTQRFHNGESDGTTPMGVALALNRFGTLGMVREVRTWGEERLGKGKLKYQAHYLNYASQNFHEMRDSYIQYQQDNMLLRIGNVYDYHELALIGVGAKFSRSLTQHTKLEGWALRSQSNMLANLIPPTNGITAAVPNMTYSLRLTGRLPLAGEAFYELSSSYFAHHHLKRSGMLNFASAQWMKGANDKFRLITGQSLEYSPGQPNRPQLLGWALGGGYDRTTKPLDIHVSGYFSTPGYSGIQRGASLLEHSLLFKKWRATRLGYRYSQMGYRQEVYTSPTELVSRQYGNTLAEINWFQQLGRFSTFLRPYYWVQSQTLPSGMLQRANSYRMQATLRYESPNGLRTEAGIDVGRFDSKAPPTDEYQIPSYRYFSSFGMGRLNVMGIYQRGPYQLNDRLPGQGDPRAFRQLSVVPAYQFSLFDGRLQTSLGAGLTFNTLVKSWNGLLYNTATYTVNDGLKLRVEVNAFSYAANLADISAVPWQESQVRFEVTKLFRRSLWKPSRTMRLRFFEDENGNQQKDPSESYVDGMVVNVGTMSMITNTKGVLLCKDLEPGLYPIRGICRMTTGEPVWFVDTVRFTKSVQLDMPIRKTWRVAGQLRCNQSKYDGQPCELDQYRLETYGPKGESFRTYADERGQFTFYLPTGQYQVTATSVQSPDLRKTIEYQVQTNNELAPLRIDVESSARPVQIKRFSSR